MTDAVTEGTLLGGRLKYLQYKAGRRSGFEPVLLAAAVPARAGERVLEAGTGAGAALLCLAARVPGVEGIGVEYAAAMAVLANENLKINCLHGISAIQADAAALPFPAQGFHHVLANPPWFGTENTASPDSLRARAHHAGKEELGAWIAELLRVLRPQGSISLILPAARFAEAAAALRPACGGITLVPLWPRAGRAAKMIILTARKGSRAADAVHPGLVLHDAAGVTPEAERILRDGEALFTEISR